MIKPTVGRVVLICFAAGIAASMHGYALPTDTLTRIPGLISAVHSDTCINVAAFDAHGENLPLQSVRLLQEGDERPTTGCWAEWVPYQIEQVKVAEIKPLEAAQLQPTKPDYSYLRAQALDMALHTCGGNGNPVATLSTATAYMDFLQNGTTPDTPPNTHQERVRAEAHDLQCKLLRLSSFLAGPGTANVNPDEHKRLLRQQEVMAQYLAILDERIAAFDGPVPSTSGTGDNIAYSGTISGSGMTITGARSQLGASDSAGNAGE